jgi:hypothetical protein
LLRSVHGDLYFVNIQVSSLFPQRFTVDIFGDAVTVCDLVFDFLVGDFQDHAVDGFICEFISKARVSQRKKSAQAKSQALVLFTCALGVRAEPLEKTRKPFLRYFLFQRCTRLMVEAPVWWTEILRQHNAKSAGRQSPHRAVRKKPKPVRELGLLPFE